MSVRWDREAIEGQTSCPHVSGGRKCESRRRHLQFGRMSKCVGYIEEAKQRHLAQKIWIREGDTLIH